jgi:hypothetical protein
MTRALCQAENLRSKNERGTDQHTRARQATSGAPPRAHTTPAQLQLTLSHSCLAVLCLMTGIGHWHAACREVSHGSAAVLVMRE